MSNRWKAGATPYKDYINSLSEEEYKEHLRKRAEKKAMKKAMETVIKEQQELWLAELNNTAAMMLMQAQQEGDVQAFTAVWDRIVGKPKEEISFNEEQPLPFDDDFGDLSPDDEDEAE